jgi:hypothetical protein
VAVHVETQNFASFVGVFVGVFVAVHVETQYFASFVAVFVAVFLETQNIASLRFLTFALCLIYQPA